MRPGRRCLTFGETDDVQHASVAVRVVAQGQVVLVEAVDVRRADIRRIREEDIAHLGFAAGDPRAQALDETQELHFAGHCVQEQLTVGADELLDEVGDVVVAIDVGDRAAERL